jgi:diaminopimelate epimerase
MNQTRVPFAKTEAHGNDFLLVEDELVAPESRPRLARAICDRLRGVGADGLILYRLYRGGEDDFAMSLYNRDGSPAEISGNGLRCLAAYLVHRDLATRGVVEISTGAGRLALSLLEREGSTFRFRANMGAPREIRTETLLAGHERFDATTLSLGNPHCVLFRQGFEVAELRRIGPVLESHPRFPRKTNVEMVEILSPADIRMAIWERGVGETASSGTGSSASAVASIWSALAGSPLRVHCPGGVMTVEWDGEGDVFLTGDATIVAEGEYLLECEPRR